MPALLRSGFAGLGARGPCNGCRSTILGFFTSMNCDVSSAIPPRGAQHFDRPSRLYTSPSRHGQTRRSFTTIRSLRGSDVSSSTIKHSGDGHHDATTADSEIAEQARRTVEVAPDNLLPWYLQVSTSSTQANPLSERQKLPHVPSDSPPLLQPILEHVSIDLGFDDLTLLDLRSLDPPPALGAGLMMILATARSERHLHISTDRFCRWLRSTHKLTPFADGLLGRNELKLKMKRAARRAKLLGSVGASTKDVDDGVRTGWICVNIGTIPGGDTVRGEKSRLSTADFVGFGEETEGTKLVLQLLTEEKREELDLEGLWDARAKRRNTSDLDLSKDTQALSDTTRIVHGHS